MDGTTMSTDIKTVEKSEIHYNALVQNLGGPETPQDKLNSAEETFSELVEGLRQISQLVQDKINVATHHQALITTMRRIETRFTLQ